jgi:hypothetical protein
MASCSSLCVARQSKKLGASIKRHLSRRDGPTKRCLFTPACVDIGLHAGPQSTEWTPLFSFVRERSLKRDRGLNGRMHNQQIAKTYSRSAWKTVIVTAYVRKPSLDSELLTTISPVNLSLWTIVVAFASGLKPAMEQLLDEAAISISATHRHHFCNFTPTVWLLQSAPLP